MTGPDRFKNVEPFEERTDADSYRGIDPVTGLPVLIYRFEGEPRDTASSLASENTPTILFSDSQNGQGRLVAALAPGWRRRQAADGPLTANELLGAARALRDAADAHLTHGDIRPERLLVVDGRVLLEGFGVPWQPRPGPFTAPEVTNDATAAGDVWSLAATLASVGTAFHDQTLSAVLELCTAAEPDDRPTAEEFYLALERLLADAPGNGAPRGERRPAKTALQSTGAGAALPASVLPAKVPPATLAQADLATTDRPAQNDGGDSGRRLALLGVLMAAVVMLALLAVYGPRGGGAPATDREAVVYVVEVFVAPDDLPPVAIHLISSPPGSSLERGDRLGTAPRHLALDRPGTWVFQGRLQDRRSEPVEITVPIERSLTLTIPGQ
ncbi:MAG: hypothetical protein WD314_00200 [Trueperaceae bacterium]